MLHIYRQKTHTDGGTFERRAKVVPGPQEYRPIPSNSSEADTTRIHQKSSQKPLTIAKKYSRMSYYSFTKSVKGCAVQVP